MDKVIYCAILIIIVADFIFERILDYLNSSCRSSSLPEGLRGIYDEEKYCKSQEYECVKHHFSLYTSSISFAIIVLMVVFGGFAVIDEFVRYRVSHPIAQSLLFFGVIGLGSGVITIPFSWYSTFVIEAKFGFNKTTPLTFLLDMVKGFFITAVMGGLLVSAVVWVYMRTQGMFWVYALAIIGGFSIFMTMFYSSIIVPLFNKQTPLEEGELKDKINSFSERVGFCVKNIFVINGSKRSSKANAYFTGFGSKKRIVLYDTLIEDMETDEVVAVLAHEAGHYKKGHVFWGLVVSLLNTALMLYLFSLIARSAAPAQALGATGSSFHMSLVAFAILYSPLSFFIGMGMNVFSRRNEFQADSFAVRNFKREALSEALKKLSVNNLSNLTPHPAYVFFYYSHPPLLQRLRKISGFG